MKIVQYSISVDERGYRVHTSIDDNRSGTDTKHYLIESMWVRRGLVSVRAVMDS